MTRPSPDCAGKQTMPTDRNHQADAAARHTIDNHDEGERAVSVANQQPSPDDRQMSRSVKKGILFALVCAAIGCPPLLKEAYSGERLEEQLSQQTEYVHQHGTWFQFGDTNADLQLTQLYSWYGGDFEQSAGSLLSFVSQQSPELKSSIAAGNSPAITWLPYDWTLNDTANRKSR